MKLLRASWLPLLAVFVLSTLFLAGPAASHTQAQNSTPSLVPSPSPSSGLFNVYRAATYNLNYPSDWKIIPRSDSETFFGIAPAPACGQPGLLVTLLGPAHSKSADILLDDYTANNTYLSTVGDRDDANDLGRFQVFRGPCTDGSIRVLRVAMFVAFGNGYRVTAFAPKAAYTQWDPAFQQIDRSFSVTADEAGQGGPLQPVYAPASAPPTLLIHVFNGNIFMANVADVPGAPLTHDGFGVANGRNYINPRIAPDGKRVAFVQLPGNKLYVAPIAQNGAGVATTVTVDPAFPLAWSSDGAQIAYIALDETKKLTVRALRLDNNTIQTLASLPYAGCSIANSNDPAGLQLIADLKAADPDGNTLALEWLSANVLLVAADCDGTGLSVLDVAASTVTPLAGLSGTTRIALAADKSALAGISSSGIVVMTLANQQSHVVPVKADRVAWAADGRTLYYTTRVISSLPTPNAAATIAGTPLPVSTIVANVTRYDLTLHQYNLLSSQDSTIYSGQGFAISRVSPAPDGSGLLFTVIQDDSMLLVAAPQNGASSANSLLKQPLAQVYWLTLPYQGGQPPTLLIDSQQIVFGPAGSAAVIGVPVTPHPGATNIPGG